MEEARIHIPEQIGGNNGAVINLADSGVPVRYIHSMAGITAYENFENTAELVATLAKELTPEIFAGF